MLLLSSPSPNFVKSISPNAIRSKRNDVLKWVIHVVDCMDLNIFPSFQDVEQIQYSEIDDQGLDPMAIGDLIYAIRW